MIDSRFSDNSKVIHFVGIGGVSMSALAEVLNFRGFVVRGSDMNKGEHTARLTKLGIKVTIGHTADNVEGADLIIRTSAIHDDNPEIIRARECGIPVIERAEAWGELMREYKNAVCVSGTHGKTTTTSMITHITLEARLNPQVMVGANLPIIGGGLRVASGDLFIAEACEYCNSFLSFYPTIAVILNVDEDHLDFFSGIDDIVASFHRFAASVPAFGAVIANADDNNAMRATEGLDQKIITFGVNSGDVMAKNIISDENGSTFTLWRNGEKLVDIKLQVSGKHNIYNALAAAAAAMELHISPKCIAAGLSKFTGASRRFEYKGECSGALVYDDYAHHPSEVSATLNAAREHKPDRIICAFQPHTYTRTNALCDDFAKALSLADIVFLADIYAAREKNTLGITSEMISSKIPSAKYVPKLCDIAEEIVKIAKPGDLILSMGAGDVYLVAEMLVNRE